MGRIHSLTDSFDGRTLNTYRDNPDTSNTDVDLAAMRGDTESPSRRFR